MFFTLIFNGAVTSENVSNFFYLDANQCPNKLRNDFFADGFYNL